VKRQTTELVERVAHLTPAERARLGRAVRDDVPRRTHGNWAPSPERADPIALLEEQARWRSPELVPIRYGRMLVSPFAFFRGAAAIMAADLASVAHTSLRAQLCGDAHLSNFGIFAAADRRLTFDINDFDETLAGPFEWDVKRLVASVAVAGRERGFSPKTRTQSCLAVARSYRNAMREFASMRTLDLWYVRIDIDDLMRTLERDATSADTKQIARDVAKARTRDSLKAFSKLTRPSASGPRIASDPPLIVPLDELLPEGSRDVALAGIRDLIRAYRRTLAADRRALLERFRFVDAAHKVVGVGSVGTQDWIVLLLGKDDDDPLFLQAKEAEVSVLQPYLGKSSFRNQGQRVVEGQRLMQTAGDIMIGWLRATGPDSVERDYYVRQLWDQKGSASIETMRASSLKDYGRLCGWALAKAHARTGDAIAICNYLGASETFDRALAAFAETYAEQNEQDYAGLARAVESGRIRVESGP
jgi:uncharacterized protein (DUF2252 family)